MVVFQADGAVPSRLVGDQALQLPGGAGERPVGVDHRAVLQVTVVASVRKRQFVAVQGPGRSASKNSDIAVTPNG